MGRKIRVKCKICGDRVLPGGRAAHLRKEHPDAEGGYRQNFEFDIVENYHRIHKDDKSKGEIIVEDVEIDDSEKLERYNFEKCREFTPINEHAIMRGNWEKNPNFKHGIYAYVIKESERKRVRYIGSTIRLTDRRQTLSLESGPLEIPDKPPRRGLNLGMKMRDKFEKEKRNIAFLYLLTQLPMYDYKGLCFEVLRDLENAFIKDFKTTREYGGWNKRSK
jgi:hypothetical protein